MATPRHTVPFFYIKCEEDKQQEKERTLVEGDADEVIAGVSLAYRR